MSKKPDVIALRALRKSSHLANRFMAKSSHFFGRVENKTSRIITNKTSGSDTGNSININEYFYRQFPQLSPVYPVLPTLGQRPSVTVFAFLDPRGFYGGIATLLCVGAALANRLGYDFRVAQTTGFSKSTDVLKFLESNGIVIPEERFSTIDLSKRDYAHIAFLPIHKDDVVLVSAWWDAHVAAQLPLQKKFLYLIQDYEPIFYNNSDSSVLAEQTYHTKKFIPICNTEILYKYFAKNDYKYIKDNAVWFEPAPAPKVEKLTPHQQGKPRRLFLYGRPHVHRNLYYNALRALDIAFSDERLRGQRWELFCAGSPDIPSVRLSSGHVINNKGKMSLEDYYDWAQTVDVAVSPMLAPHPNYPTLELSSLGAMVVSTKWETKQDLSSYSPNILMAEPTAQDMAEKIIAAATTDDKTRVQGTKHNSINTDWPTALKGPINQVAKLYE
ncbi:MAG TPA: hypothetical protein VLF43_00075 [Candidatus Saccharimonadales bacterium]|nr:hypothetical protein [Candidatus Saccharimonadales bacterium]